MTVLEVLGAATGHLEKYGVESPRLNAEHLLAHVLGKKRLDLYLEFDRSLSDAERAPLRELIRRRAQRVPLQHLLGTAEFFGRSFLCDGRALIPRPETELLVELVLAKAAKAPARFLDVGTGSGVIAITLALECPGAVVEAVDLSADALALARENAVRLGAEQVHFHQGHLLPAEGIFDIIVANLPYIATGELDTLQKEVRFDPRSALDGGEDGLGLVRELISAAPERLAPGGLIALEIGHNQAGRVAELFRCEAFTDILPAPDHQNIARFVFARKIPEPASITRPPPP